MIHTTKRDLYFYLNINLSMYHNTEHNTPYVGHEYPPQHVSHTEHQNDHYKSPRYENDFLVRSYASSIVSSVGERSGRNVRSISPKSSSVARRNYGGGSRRSRRRSISESHEHRTHLNRNHDTLPIEHTLPIVHTPPKVVRRINRIRRSHQKYRCM